MDPYADLRLQPHSPCIDAGDATVLPQDAADLDGDGDGAEALPLSAGGEPRLSDDACTADSGAPEGAMCVDIGAFEFQGNSPCRPPTSTRPARSASPTSS